MAKAKKGETGIPAAAKKKEDRVVALGEATGHYHEIVGDNAAVFVLDGNEDVMFVDLPEGGECRHLKGGAPTNEHQPVALDPGQYCREIVKELDHASQAVVNVRD